MDAHLTSLRQSTKPILDEQKHQGIIMDYKVFLKETKNPQDSDLCLAVEYNTNRDQTTPSMIRSPSR